MVTFLPPVKIINRERVAQRAAAECSNLEQPTHRAVGALNLQ